MAEWTRRDRIIGGLWVAVAVTGIVIHAVAISAPVSFGWVDDPDVPDEIFTSGVVFVFTPNAAIGAALVAIGCVGLAYVIGTVRGRRRQAPHPVPKAESAGT